MTTRNPSRTLARGDIDRAPSPILAAAHHLPAVRNNEEFTSCGPIADWRSLVRWKWTVVLFAISGLAASFVITLLQPRLYEARSSLEIQDVNDNFLNMKQVLPVNENGLSGALSDLQTQIKILQSDSVLNPVLDRLPVVSEAIVTAESQKESRWLAVEAALGLGPSEFHQVEEKRLADTLKVRAVGQTRVIELTAESTSARLAAGFLNELCTEYIDQNMKARWEMSQRTSQSLARMLEETRVKLRDSQDALENYARQSGLMFTSEKRTVAEEKLSELQDELSKAQASRIAAQARYDMTKRTSPEELPDELSQSSVREYQAKLSELEGRRAELSITYTPDYSKVKRLDAQIASLKAAIQEQEHDTVRRIESEYHAAARRESLLASSYEHQSAIVSDLAKRAVQYKILERDADGNRQLYDRMLQQVKEATVATAIRASNVRVLDKAIPPKHPYSPRPVVNCALGLLAGSFLGVLVGLTRERTDRNLREPGDGYKYVGLPELGAVLQQHNGCKLLRTDLESPARAANARPILGITESHRSERIEQLSSLQPIRRLLGGMSATSTSESLPTLESYRAVVTSILCTSIGTPQLLVITSPCPSEGKTTVLANLGITLAAMSQRVLLVDGDVRRPRLHELFGVSNDRGLSTILCETGRELHGPLDDFIQGTTVTNLSVLASGPLPSCVNFLHQPEFPKLLKRFREDYSFVLIDTPPVLQFADARIIGRIADGVVLVVRSKHTDRGAAVGAYRRLVDDGTLVFGLILNGWSPRFGTYGY